MTRLGLVGGLGPESTIDYYCRILDRWKETEPASSPSIVIDSLDVRRALGLVAQDREALTEYLLASVERLAGAGAAFVAISANTPHLVFDALAVFVIPWTLVLRSGGLSAFWVMAGFVAIVMLGWLYAYREGVLEWK